jgi:hypothetical protein
VGFNAAGTDNAAEGAEKSNGKVQIGKFQIGKFQNAAEGAEKNNGYFKSANFKFEISKFPAFALCVSCGVLRACGVESFSAHRVKVL